MPYPQFDRSQVRMKPLAERRNKVVIERDCARPGDPPRELSAVARETIAETAARIRQARRADRPVIIAFGAHTIKNGLAPVLIHLIEQGWLTHLAANGAGIIHDWEFAFQGASSEDVRANLPAGEFGNWQETGFYINLALNIGAFEGRGYGESVGALIENEGLTIPGEDELLALAREKLNDNPEQAAAAADLLHALRRCAIAPDGKTLAPGALTVPHRWKKYSVQAVACRLGVPCTGHPMFGHDIIYNHPMNHGALLGRCAERDFLTFAEGVSRIDGGVYLSIGSAVMSPMIFEKALSMAQNLALQRGGAIERHFILVADLAESNWDWRQGEPPEHRPEYYQRFNKTFSRTGGEMRYLCADNRDFLLALCQELNKVDSG